MTMTARPAPIYNILFPASMAPTTDCALLSAVPLAPAAEDGGLWGGEGLTSLGVKTPALDAPMRLVISAPAKVLLFGSEGTGPCIVASTPHRLELIATTEPGLDETVLDPSCALLERAFALLPPPPVSVRLSVVSTIPDTLDSSAPLLVALVALSRSWRGAHEEQDAICAEASSLASQLQLSDMHAGVAAASYGGCFVYHAGQVTHRFSELVERTVALSAAYSPGRGAGASLVEEAMPFVEAWDVLQLQKLAAPPGIAFGKDQGHPMVHVGAPRGLRVDHNGIPARLVRISHELRQSSHQHRETGTASAPSNIALLKYWGKQTGRVQMADNPSLSLTLGALRTSTVVSKAEGPGAYPDERAKKFVNILLKATTGAAFPVHVKTENGFPSACGIASSASGFAALVEALADLLGLENSPLEADDVAFWKESWARLGSGSAIRSLYSGLVGWEGDRAVQIEDPLGWGARMRHMVVVFDAKEKEVSSSTGHRSAGTSLFHSTRVAGAPATLDRLKAAIKTESWPELSAIVEADATIMHAVMQTSSPAACYPTQATMEFIQYFVAARDKHGLRACWTLDAGPNPHLIMHPDDAVQVRNLVLACPHGRFLYEAQDCTGPLVGDAVARGPKAIAQPLNSADRKSVV